LKPFHRQHPVRGYFGDPRTVVYAPRLGLFSFHNGIDISAWTGNAVYPVVSGVVVRVESDEVVVRSPHRRRFQYIHVRPRVDDGDLVIQSRTVLGNVPRRWEHVHLTEIRGSCVVNPLAAGHLAPYRDRTIPRIASVTFRTPAGNRLNGDRLYGSVDAIARAQDTPAMLGSGPWRQLPVAPALIRWRIATLSGERVAGGTTVDFRTTEPPPQDFCRIYAKGTAQNFAAEPGRYEWGKPGRYLFQLTPVPFDTRTLPDGRYDLTVTATDTAGNSGRLTVRVTVVNRGVERRFPPAAADWRCVSRALTIDRVRVFRRLHSDRQPGFPVVGNSLSPHLRRPSLSR
jgi:hypothetical protein